MAPLRIQKSGGLIQVAGNGAGVAAAAAVGGSQNIVDSYLSRLVKVIPGEAVGSVSEMSVYYLVVVSRVASTRSERRFRMWHVYCSRGKHNMLFERSRGKGLDARMRNTFRTNVLYSVFAFVLLVAVGVISPGCSSNPASTQASESVSASTPPSQSTLISNPTTPPEATPTSTASTGCTAQPDIICGRPVDSQGHPLGGASASVSVFGVSTSGEQLDYPLVQPNTDGTYSIQVTDGVYMVQGYTNPTYQGIRWNLTMHPDDNSQVGLPSTSGIIKNFTWELTGLEPPPADGTPLDPADPYQHYGAVIGLELDGTPPVGSRFQFTLTPQGPLVDGSTGQTLVFTRTVNSSVVSNFTFAEGQYPATPGYQGDNFLSDIPLGVYSLSITATDPSGNALSLQFDYGGNGTSVQWQPDPTDYAVGNLTVTVGS